MSPPLEEIGVGDAVPPLVKGPLERTQFAQYADASGDLNRIHLEESFAREAGFKDVFAHGMLTMGFLGQLVTDWLGGPGLVRLQCRFRAIVWPGDTLTCQGRVESKTEGRVELALSVKNQEGVLVADGSAVVEVAISNR